MFPKKRFSILAVSISIFLCTTACAGKKSETQTEFLLGTTCSVTLTSKHAKQDFDRVFTLVQEIEQTMSVHVEESDVSKINAMAGKTPVSVEPETFYLIERAVEIAEETEGALDITVGPFVEEWGIGTEHPKVPAIETIENLLSFVDYRSIVLDKQEQSVYLPRQRMKIDLGALAKGYAAHEAVKVLQEEGVARGIIDFGGNIMVFGTKESKEPWRIGIQQPEASRGHYFGIVEVDEGAVVSSGTYERFFVQDGVRYHHILDPAAGRPVRNGLDSVTILAESGTDADAYSTAVFVLGLEKGYRFIESKPELEAVLVTVDKEVYITSGLEDRFLQNNPNYIITQFE